MDTKGLIEVGKALAEPIKTATTNVLDKPTKELGEGIGDLFWMIFSPIHKARMVREIKIQAYVKEIESELAKIPADKTIEPPLNIIGPALEASKYYIENDEIRKMFAKLIASSANQDKEKAVHPSFIEIIKQFSPLDAQVLKTLFDNHHLPIAGLFCQGEKEKPEDVFNTSPTIAIMNDVIPLPNLTLENSGLYIASVQNLSRLSIIEISYESQYANKEKYKLLDDFLEDAKKEFGNSNKYPEYAGQQIKLREGIWNITTLGILFISCCLDDSE